MEQYIRRFCEVKKPRDIVNFLESFVYVWPWALASLFGLYYVGANWLPRSFVVAGIGLALAEAARLLSSTISPYSTDYHLVEALKVVAMTIGTVVVAAPCAIVLSDCVDDLVLATSPSFFQGQFLSAKLGVAVGTLLFLFRSYLADVAHDPGRPQAPSNKVPVLNLTTPPDQGGGGGALARVAKLKLKARAIMAYLADVRDSVEDRRRGGELGQAFYATFLVADVAPIVVTAFFVFRSFGGICEHWMPS